MKLKLYCWLPNKKNGNPKHWAFNILPSLSMSYCGKSDWYIDFAWLFWTIDLRNSKYF